MRRSPSPTAARVPRPPGVQDTASQFVELSHRFATGQDVLEVGRSVSFWMARPGGGGPVDLRHRRQARCCRRRELGAVEAFHLKPRPIANPRGNITAEMWFAPSLQYLPVRIRVNMGDATYRRPDGRQDRAALSAACDPRRTCRSRLPIGLRWSSTRLALPRLRSMPPQARSSMRAEVPM